MPAGYDKYTAGKEFLIILQLIARAVNDGGNFVKKAVSRIFAILINAMKNYFR